MSEPESAVATVVREMKEQLKGLGWADVITRKRTPTCYEMGVREFPGDTWTVTVEWDEEIEMVRVRRQGDEL